MLIYNPGGWTDPNTGVWHPQNAQGWTDRGGAWHDQHGDAHEWDWDSGYYDAYGNWIFYEPGKMPKANAGLHAGMNAAIDVSGDIEDGDEVKVANPNSPSSGNGIPPYD